MLNLTFIRTHHFRCPDEQELAAYVGQQLIGAERERVESHIAKCDSCLRQIGFLVRHANGVDTPVPARFLARARQLKSGARKDSPLVWAWAGVAAAIVLVVISATLGRQAQLKRAKERAVSIAAVEQRQSPDSSSNPDLQADDSVRSRSQGVSLPVVLFPQPGATVHASDFSIRWQPISHAVAYEVRVVTADGSLVWHKRVRAVSVRPPAQILRSGSKYFVWVRALLADGDTQVSPAVSFIGG